MRRAFLLALLAAGCGLPPSTQVSGEPANICASASDCSSEAACVQSRCVATSYDLKGLLLTMRLDASAAFAAGGTYVVNPAALNQKLVSTSAHDQPFVSNLSVVLPSPVSIKAAKVIAAPSTPAQCLSSDHTVPANITFYRSPALAGLPVDPVHATTTVTGSSYSFDVDIVSGPNDVYDVYIEPTAPMMPAPGCVVPPPYLVPGQSIDAGKTLWQLPPASSLSGSILGLLDPTDWQLDVVEPARGLVISAGSEFGLKMGYGSTLGAQFSPLLDPTQSPILRLSPVSMGVPDPTRPTVYWTLAGAVSGGTPQNPQVTLTNDLLSSGTTVEGQVFGSDGTTGVPSQLLIQSTQLVSADLAANASYMLNVSTAGVSPGQFTIANMPPGDYTIRAVPTMGAFSITDAPLLWPMGMQPTSCVCGKSIMLSPKATLMGSVTTPTGAPMTYTPTAIAPSELAARSYLETTHKLPPLPARDTVASTDGSGAFSMQVDLGSADFLVQPDPATSYPWLVIPRLPVGQELKGLAMKNPAFLGGTVTDAQGNPVVNAEIDAWFPVRDASAPNGLAGTVVNIATTSTDDAGNYTLVLPSSVGP